MKSTELRIGSWYIDGGVEFQLEADRIPSFVYGGYMPSGIPLTEEWLVKFGFTVNSCVAWISTTDQPNHTSYYQAGQFVLSFDGDFWWLSLGDYRVGLYAKIEFVHQLQNAFALTGTELTIQS